MSVDTEEEAESLLLATCARNDQGEFVSVDLAQEQTVERLFAFGDKLEKVYKRMKERRRAR